MDVIMVAVGKTAESVAALDRAVWLAGLSGGRVLLVSHVTDPRNEASARGYREARESESEYVRRLGEKKIPESIPWDWHVSTLSGRTGSALAQVAREQGATVVVLGIRRRTAVGKLVLGSTAQNVLLEADCPVLAVKSESDR